jgi:hypothetical protein
MNSQASRPLIQSLRLRAAKPRRTAARVLRLFLMEYDDRQMLCQSGAPMLGLWLNLRSL